MNKTKFILIILSIIFALADVGWLVYQTVNYFTLDVALRSPIFYAIYDIIVIAVDLAVVVMLTMAIWGNGKCFRQRYGLYMTALVLSVIFNLTTVSTILLVVTMFISDWVWVKKSDIQKDESIIVVPSKQELVASLRAKKERGEITEEQFQEEIMKLL